MVKKVMTTDPQGSNRDVLVLVPARLKVIAANAILERANQYEEGSEIRKGLYTLAGQVDILVATGRNDRESVYDQVAKATGVPRDKVKDVIHAFGYSVREVTSVRSTSGGLK